MDTSTAYATTYFYEVAAVNGDNVEGPLSAEVMVTTEPAPAPQVGWWLLDDGSGLGVADSSGNGWDGSLLNGPLWGEGRIDGGLVMDGADDVVDLPAGVLDGGDDVSVALWFQTTKTGQQALISGANASNSNEFLVFLLSDVEIRFDTGEDGSSVSWTVASVADGLWHHLAVVRDGSNGQVTLYIDGASQGTKSATLNPLQIDAGGLVLGQEQDSVGGGYTASQAFAGTLDEVRLYNQALTATEITTLATPPIS